VWREVGEDVLGACRRMERLLDACLVLARSRAGACRLGPVDLSAIARRVVRTRDLGGLSLRSSLERTAMVGDAALIERLVDNVVENALRIGGWTPRAPEKQLDGTTTAKERVPLCVDAGSSGGNPPADGFLAPLHGALLRRQQ
jgi:hypothetical protein